MRRAQIKTGYSRNVRDGAGLAARDIGTLPERTIVHALENVGGGWWRCELATDAGGGDVVFGGRSFFVLIDNTYTWLDPEPLPPPVAGRPRIRIGFNCVNNHHVFDRAWELGFRAALVCNDFARATQLSERAEAPTILARRVEYNAHDAVTGAAQLEGMGAPKVIYTSHNEQDNIGGGIRERFAEDLAMAEEARRRGTRFAGGGWSQGTPDFTNPQLRQDMADTYARAYNDGVMDLHLHPYASDRGEVEAAPGKAGFQPWYSTRPGFLFADCGFSVTGRGRLHFSEACVDKGGGGGMKHLQYTPTEVVEWFRAYIRLLTNPWVSPITGRTIPFVPVSTILCFQLGDTTRWAGYEMSEYLEAMAAAGLANPQ